MVDGDRIGVVRREERGQHAAVARQRGRRSKSRPRTLHVAPAGDDRVGRWSCDGRAGFATRFHSHCPYNMLPYVRTIRSTEIDTPDPVPASTASPAAMTSRLHRTVPIVRWLPRYDRRDLRTDLIAGFTISALLIPQGSPTHCWPAYHRRSGLYASIAPVIAYAIFGTSRQLAVGPVAIVSLMTATTLGTSTSKVPTSYLAMPPLLALLVGADPSGAAVRAARLRHELPLALGARRLHRRVGRDHRGVAGQARARHLDPPHRVRAGDDDRGRQGTGHHPPPDADRSARRASPRSS